MTRDVQYDQNAVIIRDICDFDPDTILFCGQAFRWEKENGLFKGIAHGRIIHLEMTGKDIRLFPASKNEYEMIWEDYFDLKRDYSALKKEFSKDVILQKGMEFAPGMRVLNQQPFETMISFIVSANNNVKRISGIIQKLSVPFGKKIEYQGETGYAFPEPQALADASEEDLRRCGTGYRAAYIKAAAKAVCEGFDLEALKKLPYADAKKELTKIPGIGPKVADCILLYSLGFAQAFPSDVWIKRTLFNLYGCTVKSDKEIAGYVCEKFGKHAGIAQQYLFHYVRKNKLGMEGK